MLIDKVNVTKSDSTRKKFKRRKDLTEKIRMTIAVRAYLAQEYHQWGEITSIANKYGVSRPFVYDAMFKMKESLSMTFGENSSGKASDSVQDSLKHILSLRMEGRCSTQGISTCMKRFGLENSSVGFISQYLTNVGSQLPVDVKHVVA